VALKKISFKNAILHIRKGAIARAA
jgi:hypothetical protein